MSSIPKPSIETMWEEFIVYVKIRPDIGKVPMCGIYGGSGIFDTRGNAKCDTGVDCGSRNFCICPNGRYRKNHEKI